MEKTVSKSAAVLWLSIVVCFGGGESLFAGVITDFSKPCVACHQEATPGLVNQWEKSAHFQGRVGCYECHQAGRGDADAMEHEKTIISVIVSPKDCAKCHQGVVEEFGESRHAAAYDLTTGSIGLLVGEFLLGHNELKTAAFPKGASAANADGCWKCHGSEVKLDKSGEQVKLDPATWPNTGIGRINPDGSRGSCSACHPGHDFSSTQPRQPEMCRKCHSGESSLYEYMIYMQSGHGVNYTINKGAMNLDSSSWVAGVNYSAAPTCATCHMTAVPAIGATHNINQRIRDNRNKMANVCAACHTKTVYGNYSIQAKAQGALVDNKWKKPTTELYCIATELLKKMEGDAYNLLTHPVDYTYLSMGQYINVATLAAQMMSPQFVEDNNKALATNWYSAFTPRIQTLIERGEAYSESKNPETDPGPFELAEKLRKRLDYWKSKPTYGSGKWPDASLADCPGSSGEKK